MTRFSIEVKPVRFPCIMWQFQQLAGFLCGFADLTQIGKNNYKYLIPLHDPMQVLRCEGIKEKL